MSTDAIVLLRNDHTEVRKLFREFQKPQTTDARKGAIVTKVIELLTAHTYIENEVMYPASARCCRTWRTTSSSPTRSTTWPTSWSWSCTR